MIVTETNQNEKKDNKLPKLMASVHSSLVVMVLPFGEDSIIGQYGAADTRYNAVVLIPDNETYLGQLVTFKFDNDDFKPYKGEVALKND